MKVKNKVLCFTAGAVALLLIMRCDNVKHLGQMECRNLPQPVQDTLNFISQHFELTMSKYTDPTPDNTLYIDASTLDFGNLSTKDFPAEHVGTSQNLFNLSNSMNSIFNGRLRNTVYALGRIKMILLDRNERTVSIVNDEAAIYDWNGEGGFCRNLCININNYIYDLNPRVHGFMVYYYGIGRLRK